PKEIGAIRLCHLLNARGGVLCEFTVLRLGAESFYLISSPRAEALNFDVLSQRPPKEGGVQLRNATLERGCLAVVGPNARDILRPIASVDLSNESFPWLTARSAVVGLASDVRTLRIIFEGELGWELYHPIAYQLHLLETIMAAGREHGLRLVGNRAIDCLRLEKSYPNIWRDLNGEYTAWESGLERFVALEKGDFPGRDALVRQKQEGVARRLVTLRIETQDELEALGNESVFADGALVGRITSANHAHFLGYNIALAYLDAAACRPGVALHVPVLNALRPAILLERSPYDPAGKRSRM
ncbi:MAG: aminomethyltransferase family protein, partial [Alphaproteobacteria bacterium]|nr:aminomethyltransferase family protein [Alphaproteobacteria bacterium]